MSELIKERVKNSLGKTITIFTTNDFRYRGKLINADEIYLEILDFKKNSFKLLKYEEIKEFEVEND